MSRGGQSQTSSLLLYPRPAAPPNPAGVTPNRRAPCTEAPVGVPTHTAHINEKESKKGGARPHAIVMTQPTWMALRELLCFMSVGGVGVVQQVSEPYLLRTDITAWCSAALTVGVSLSAGAAGFFSSTSMGALVVPPGAGAGVQGCRGASCPSSSRVVWCGVVCVYVTVGWASWRRDGCAQQLWWAWEEVVRGWVRPRGRWGWRLWPKSVVGCVQGG